MITRVFCYSKEEAEKNGNKLPILQVVLTGIALIIVPLVFGIVMSSIEAESFMIWIIVISFFIGLLIYFSLMLGTRLRTRMSGFALDSNGKLYKAMTTNNGDGLYFGGLAAGKLVDKILDNNSNIGGTVGGALGAYAQFSAMNRAAKFMSHPEVVAQMVEQAKDITGGQVFAIEKIHSYTENKRSIKIVCDYQILKNGKMKYNKKLSIEKSYNYFEELKNQIYNYPKN